MGKQGPCTHCGVTSTPLWRNGPVEKPVLCNACGSRWRTKGSLANYTPLHARLDPDGFEDHRVARVKTIPLKRRDETLNKRKLNFENTLDVDYTPDYSHGFRKNLDEDTSNRSSSGSAISNSESCAQFGSADASDMTGPAHSMAWDSLPSRKRTCIIRPKQSSVEKLTKDLHTILHEQASRFSGSSGEDLLFESEAPMGSVEFGHGSVLIRNPSSMAKDEESEASSLSVDNKLFKADEGYTTPMSLMPLDDSKSMYNSCFGVGKGKKLNGQIMHAVQVKREKSNREKLQILWNQNSPLHQIDLNEVVNSDVFLGYLTDGEQQDLLKYLPNVDTSTPLNSLKNTFASPHFMENLSSFRDLLAEGMLDSSLPRIKTEDCKILKRLAFYDMTKCKWVEHYNMMKDKISKQSTEERVSVSATKSSSSGNMIIAKKSRDYQNCPEVKTTPRTPKRVDVKAEYPNGSSLMIDSLKFEDESYNDQDLLIHNIPSNGSFAEAELLLPVSSFAARNPSAYF